MRSRRLSYPDVDSGTHIYTQLLSTSSVTQSHFNNSWLRLSTLYTYTRRPFSVLYCQSSHGSFPCPSHARGSRPFSPNVSSIVGAFSGHIDEPSSENWPNWHQDHPTIDETLIARCASYRAFDRYLAGADLLLPPRTRPELESIL